MALISTIHYLVSTVNLSYAFMSVGTHIQALTDLDIKSWVLYAYPEWL